MKKKPWLAALLNFFLFGAGTLYVGRRGVGAAALVTLGGTAVQLLEIKQSPPFENLLEWPWFFGGLLLVKVGLAIDGYRDALSAAALAR
ncbi:MAG TPA: hypothetical protein VMI54_10125 [Polyangiaceae bacterium]|nr:hypothetical protein [Polyangiaceae bacterium]